MAWRRGRNAAATRGESREPDRPVARRSGDGRVDLPAAAGPRPPAGPVPPAPGGAAERAAHRLYVQVAWTTLDGLPLLAPDAREAAEARLIALCRRLDAEPVAVRATATDVSLLLRVTPSHAVGALATALKAGSEDALAAAGRPVRWARGFAASSVGPTDVRRRARALRSAPRDVRRPFARPGTTLGPSRIEARLPTLPAAPPA